MEVKLKKCKNPNCGGLFKPFTSIQACCSSECTREREKERKKEREARETGTQEVSKSLVYQAARIAVNAYIRERDKNERCICCGKPLGSDYQAGHFFSGGGHAAVIFDEDNIHAQRKECNEALAGNIEGYAVGIEQRIGKARLELLRSKAYEIRKYGVPELQSIIREYKQKFKQLKK